MRETIYNYDNLADEDINEVVIRIKALIINNDNIYIGNADSVFQFPGGHLEKGESFNDCLKREVLEETGIELDDSEIERPFMKVTFKNKDWPEKGINRKAEIYYYFVKTSKMPNLNKVKLTNREKENNFKIEIIPLKDSIQIIRDNIPNNKKNKVISPDMIDAIEEYLKQTNN